MMESNEMIYTAIFQTGTGDLTHIRYSGCLSRKQAWLDAAREGAQDDRCLLALVSGDHPVYFYQNFVEDVSVEQSHSIKDHDLFDNKL